MEIKEDLYNQFNFEVILQTMEEDYEKKNNRFRNKFKFNEIKNNITFWEEDFHSLNEVFKN